MKIKGYFNRGIPGTYGNRIFISILEKEANEKLAKLSIWGGADKRWTIDSVVHNGYEFADDKWDRLLELINGFISLVDFTGKESIEY